ncbi:MAG: family peptidase [Microbacterium sp.]|nr:family peptidase [Microbacterium sp.]
MTDAHATNEHAAETTDRPEPWRERFAVPVRYGVRPARGDADLVHLIVIDRDGQSVQVWDPERVDGPVTSRPIDGDLLNAVPSADGRSIVVLRELGPAGSELGHAWLVPLETTGEGRDLTPDLPAYSLRGIDVTADDRHVLLTTASADGFELWLVDAEGASPPRCLFRSAFEAWNGRISADGATVTLDGTDHSPGVRRWAVTAIDVATAAPIAVAFDEPAGTARCIRWSAVAGDDRALLVSERTGYARPLVWEPRRDNRIEFELPGLAGDVHPLDWSPDASRILAAHVDEGVHRLVEIDVATGEMEWIEHPPGAVFQPDIASTVVNERYSHYAADGTIRVTVERYDRPLEIWARDARGALSLALPAAADFGGTAFRSEMVTAPDGVRSQMWIGTPDGPGPFPTVLEVHGGPTFVVTDHFDPVAQAWIDEGFAFVSLNYRGSVTFGREFRERFVGNPGPGELSDIRSAVEQLVATGVARPGALFITGESYGGFLTLMSLGRMPDLFSGGMAFVPMADWAIAYDDMSPALQGAISWYFGGHPDEVPEAYAAASAIGAVDGVRAPVWISQGRHDTRTPPRQVEAYVDALRARGGDVTLEWFEGGHITVSLDAVVADQRELIDLARRALRGERWSEPAEVRA